MNDYELVLFSKNGQKEFNEAALVLYTRYKPLISKFACKVSSGGRDFERKKDFEQDAYLKVISCLKSTRLERIKISSLNWNFSSRLKFYLLNILKDYYKGRKTKNELKEIYKKISKRDSTLEQDCLIENSITSEVVTFSSEESLFENYGYNLNYESILNERELLTKSLALIDKNLCNKTCKNKDKLVYCAKEIFLRRVEGYSLDEIKAEFNILKSGEFHILKIMKYLRNNLQKELYIN